jgi:hypothetical protein
LFTASAAVVIWQNTRLAVLWDASYVLENASRIAAGDVPYREFPIPYAPLTFLGQAAIIRILGRAYWQRDIRWVIVKRSLQINGTPYPDLPATLRLLSRDFQPYRHLANYDVHARRPSATVASCWAISPRGAWATVALSKRTSTGSNMPR